MVVRCLAEAFGLVCVALCIVSTSVGILVRCGEVAKESLGEIASQVFLCSRVQFCHVHRGCSALARLFFARQQTCTAS